MRLVLVAPVCALLLVGSARADEAVDPAIQRMLAPLRERSLGAEALVDSLHLRGDERVADSGAGPGFFTLKLAQRVPKGHVIATDIDARALSLLTQRASAASLTNIEAHPVGPAEPGLAPRSVDLAFMCQVDHYLADRVSYLEAVRSTLRPKGRLVLVNADRFRDANRAAAAKAGFELVEERSAAPGYFVMVWHLPGGG